MLQPHPESIHFAHILEDEINGIGHISVFRALELRSDVRQLVFHHFEEIVPQKEAPDRLLNTLDHIEEIPQNQFDRCLFGLDISRANCDEQVQSRNNVASVLHRLVQITHFPAAFLFFNEVVLQVG